MEKQPLGESAHEQPKSTKDKLIALLDSFIAANDEWTSPYSTEKESDDAYQRSVVIQDKFRESYFKLSKEEQEEMDAILEKRDPIKSTLIKRNDKQERE